MLINKETIKMKKIVDKRLLSYDLEGIKRSSDRFGYKLDDLSERDIFMQDVGQIQILNSLLNIKDGLQNIKWKKKNE